MSIHPRHRPGRREITVLGLTIALCSLLAVLLLAGRDADPGHSAADPAGGLEAPGTSGPDRARAVPPSLPTESQAGTGPHTLPGTVLDAAGNPVAGAAITAEIELGPGMEVAGPGLDTTPVVVAVAGPDGTFSLVGMEAGRHRLRVEAEGIFPSEVRFFEVPADGVRLVVARKVAVQGQVVDATGMPVADMPVRLVSEASGQIEARTDAAGGFVFAELAEGVFHVWAGAGELATPAQVVARLGPGPFEPALLTLGPAAVVTGRVVDRATRQGVSAAVVLSATDSEEPPRYGQSDAHGNFRIEAVPMGRWSADAFAPGYIATEAIELDTGSAIAPVIELTRGGVVAGRVVDQRNQPIMGAVVSVRGTGADGRALAMSEQSLTRTARQFRGRAGPALAGEGPRFIPRGELGVMRGPIPFPPPRGAAALRFAARILEAGDASGEDGALPGLSVPEEVAPAFVTDAQGRFRLTGLPAGQVQVVATHPDYADGTSRIATLGLGERLDDVTVVLVPGVFLVGMVMDQHEEPIVGATLVAQAAGPRAGKGKSGSGPGGPADLADLEASADGARLQAVTGTDGRYRMGPLTSRVRVQVTAVGYGQAERVVNLADQSPDQTAGQTADEPAERTEDFVLVSADATLRGIVRDLAAFPVRGAAVVIQGKESSAAGRRAITDDTGRFYIDQLAPGRYTLNVTHEGFPALATEAGTEAPAEIALPFGGGMAGEVRDVHTGAPVAGARLSARGPGQARAATATTTATADDGAFVLVPLAAGSWTVQVTAAGYVPLTRTVDVPAGQRPGETTAPAVRIELARGATVAGTVRDRDGVRASGVRVSAGAAHTRTDAEGSFLLRDVPAGDTEVTAERDGLRGQLTVPLRPGDEVMTLELTIE